MPPEVVLIGASELLRVVKEKTASLSTVMRTLVTADSAKQGKTITCMKGCAQCCYQKMMGTAGEGLAIYMLLREQKRWTEELKTKLVAADRFLTDHDHATYFEKKVPCVFLNETTQGYGLCSVYEARPMHCASTFSNGGDPQKCSRPGGEDMLLVFYQGEEMHEYMMLNYSLKDSVDPGPEDPRTHMLMTLPGAVLWAGAAFEGKPPPKVLRTQISKGSEFFDSFATHKKGGPW